MSINLSDGLREKVCSYKNQLELWCKETESYLVDHSHFMSEYSEHISDLYTLYNSSVEGSSAAELILQFKELANKYTMPQYAVYTHVDEFSFVGKDGQIYKFRCDIDVRRSDPYDIEILLVTSNDSSQDVLLWKFNSTNGEIDRLYQNDAYFDTVLNAQYTQLSLSNLGLSMGDIYSAMSVATEATRQYLNGVVSFDSIQKLISDVGVGRSRVCENLSLIFANNFKTLTASPSTWLTGIKTILGKLTDATFSNNEFHFGLDTYEVGAEIFIGVRDVVSAISSVVSTVTTIFKPLLGLAISAIGAVADKVIEVISTNNSDKVAFNSDPDIVCFGQNVFRSMAYLANFDYTFASYDGDIIQAVSPISCSLVYNHVKQDSLHRSIVPVQEFIIPVIPCHYTAWEKFVEIYTGPAYGYGTGSWVSDGSRSYYQQTIFANGIDNDLSITGVQERAVEYLKYINDHPDYFHFCTEDDADSTVQFGVSIALTLWKLIAVQPDLPIHTDHFLIQNLNYLAASNLMNHLRNSDMETDNFIKNFVAFGWMMMYSVQDVGNYNSDQQVFDVWLEKVLYNPGTNYYMNGVAMYNWSTLVNEVMLENIAVGSIANEIFSAGSLVPNAVVPIEAKSGYSVYIVPPKQSVNLWIRLALTIGAIVLATSIAAITYYSAKKRARRSFSTRCEDAKLHYDKWIETGDDSEYAAYKQSMRRANFSGRLFGFGTYDVANGWVNSSISSTGGIMNTILRSDNATGSSIAEDILSLGTNLDRTIQQSVGALSDDVLLVKRSITGS